jgi:ATP-dependent helicase HrpB
MLPIEEVLPDLRRALKRGPNAVLVAAPGAGKTTAVPLALMAEPWAQDRRIIVLSPRRVAARAAAGRMAAMLGEPVGRTVGYRVRFENRTSTATRLEVVTEGVFTRQILADPTLEGVAGVFFDEFHERSLEGDLGLALAIDAQRGLNEGLRLLVMSATLAAGPAAALLGGAATIVSEGRLYPVALRYLGRPRGRLDEAIADAVRRALEAETGSILVFLPGAREIERTAERLAERGLPDHVELHRLYGALDARAQDAAIAPPLPGRRKIVLASSIAETSLTIEGVRVVIDAGLSRTPRFEPGLGLTRLETVRASQASATQRAGRAGRLEPGVCWRLWDEAETRALPAFDPPEILNADLSGLALDLALWGVGDPGALAWLDPPPAAAFREARSMLEGLGALDAAGRITTHGRMLAELPLAPRLAHMTATAAAEGAGALAARLAVLISEQGLGGRDLDLTDRLERFGRERGGRAESARALAESLARRAGDRPRSDGKALRPGPVLARAFPDRIAAARPGKKGEFLLANGRAASLDADHPLAREAYLAVGEIQGAADRARILSAAPLTIDEIERHFGDAIAHRAELVFDAAARAVRGRRARLLGAITLSEGPLDRMDPEAATAALLAAVKERGLATLRWPESAIALRARLAYAAAADPAGNWPNMGEAALNASCEDWLALAVDGADPRLEALEARLPDALLAMIDHAQRRRLDHFAPAIFETPAGGRAPIDYGGEGGPAVAVRLQELFGLDRHPSVGEGRTPLTLLLLSPAGRPVQTTKDLPGFWRGSYESVRREMRGRYPKHPWPEDPLQAPPTRRAKPRPSG